MGNPLLHRFHRNPVDLIPKLNLFVVKMLILDKRAFKLQLVRKYNSILFIQIQIPCFDHSIEHTVVMHAIAHRLSDNHINLSIEIFERKYLNDMLQLIFLYNLFHHPNILLLTQIMPIHNAINFCCPSFCRINRVKTVAPSG